MRRYFDEEKPSPEELLHYGVKGMRWGVRKEEETSGRNRSSAEKLKAAHKPKPQPPLKKAAANLAEHEEKFKNKFKSDDPKTKGTAGAKIKKFASDHKGALITGGAITALILANVIAEKKTVASIENLRGKSIDANTFAKHVQHSKMKTWARNDHIHETSWARDEFELPAGHTFHRISTKQESGYSKGTYATHSTEDFNRYVAQFRQELTPGADGLNHVSFQSTEPIRVPKFSMVLESLRETMGFGPNFVPPESHVLAEYQKLSGGSWNNSQAEKLFGTLRKKGYGAIVDEMDAGVIGETPLVVFARDILGEKSNTPLTHDDIVHAESNLIEIENRKY